MEALFSGAVQGVGFRYTTVSIARGYDVTGYVRNLYDGRVQLVAEGDPKEVRAFVNAVRREMGPHIRDVTENTQTATGEFVGFSVRR